MHNQESVLENFEMQTDQLFSARRSDLVRVNKKGKLTKLWILLFCQTTE